MPKKTTPQPGAAPSATPGAPPGASPSSAPWPTLPDALKGSAHDVWLAGLAALSRAQQEGGKVVEALVQEGLAIQRKTQATAQDKAREAGKQVQQLASELGEKASGQWGKLESIFEERVARALHGLGMPTASEVQALAQRITALEEALAATLRSTQTKVSTPTQARAAAKKSSTRSGTKKAAARTLSSKTSRTTPRSTD